MGDTDVFAPLAIRAPLAAWSNEDVAGYIREHEIELPEHYTEVRDSFECWCCPALPGAAAPQRVAYLRRRYPHLHERLRPLIERVNGAVQEAADQYGDRAKAADSHA